LAGKRETMKKVLIYGIGNKADLVARLLDRSKVQLLGYVKDDALKYEQYKGYPLYSVADISHLHFDCLLYAEDEKAVDFPIERNRVIHPLQSLSFFAFITSPEFWMIRFKALEDMQLAMEHPERNVGLITGMSYTQRGLVPAIFDEPFILAAHPSQDMFYDLIMLADAIDRLGPTLDHVIMGISPFQFRYDLSLSKAIQSRSLYYYQQTGIWHHHTMEISGLEAQDKEIDELFCENWRRNLYEAITTYPFHVCRDKFLLSRLSEQEMQTVRQELYKVADKPYTASVSENTEFFLKYLSLCAANHIRVTCALPPFPDCFRSIFPEEILEETRQIVRNNAAKINNLDFRFVDSYEDPDFTEEHFADEQHLNVYGAELWSEKLKPFISRSSGSVP
jgi:hypothetical protein